MKFEELEIGKRYYIDYVGTTGVLLWGNPNNDKPGFDIDQKEHCYDAGEDGLVRFLSFDDFEYSLVELED
jgi:hypothetical protein